MFANVPFENSSCWVRVALGSDGAVEDWPRALVVVEMSSEEQIDPVIFQQVLLVSCCRQNKLVLWEREVYVLSAQRDPTLQEEDAITLPLETSC